MEKKTVIIIIVVAAILLCLCAAAIAGVVALGGFGLGAGLAFTEDMKNAGDEFLGALEAQDYRQAFQMMHPELQLEVGGPVRLADQLRDAGFSVDSWTTTSRSVENESGELEGVITDIDGDKWDYYLALIKEGDKWQVIEYNFDFQG